FPIGNEGGAQRLRLDAAAKDAIDVEVGLRTCSSCGKRWFLPTCSCGGHTVARNGPARQRVPLAEVLRTALDRLGEPKPAEIKAVQGMISKNKTPEPIEKGILRAKHEIYVFKDGTTRFDMTNLPLTHFTPKEAGISVDEARRLGYSQDGNGRPWRGRTRSSSYGLRTSSSPGPEGNTWSAWPPSSTICSSDCTASRASTTQRRPRTSWAISS